MVEIVFLHFPAALQPLFFRYEVYTPLDLCASREKVRNTCLLKRDQTFTIPVSCSLRRLCYGYGEMKAKPLTPRQRKTLRAVLRLLEKLAAALERQRELNAGRRTLKQAGWIK